MGTDRIDWYGWEHGGGGIREGRRKERGERGRAEENVREWNEVQR